MSTCEAMQDRMPEVACGRAVWTAAEAGHLASCAECAVEWRLVLVGAALHAGVTVDAERAVTGVLTRLRGEPVVERPIRRIPWRGSLIGLLAAAASVALVVWAPREGNHGADESADTTVAALAPELQGMDEGQLSVVLQSIQPAAAENLPSMTTHLDDLTDAQLERLLHAMGGE